MQKVKYPCNICLQPVTKKNGLRCHGDCQSNFHYRCLNYTPGRVSDVKKGLIAVTCPCMDCTSTAKKELRNRKDDSLFCCPNVNCPGNLPPSCTHVRCPNNVSRRPRTDQSACRLHRDQSTDNHDNQGAPTGLHGCNCKQSSCILKKRHTNNDSSNIPKSVGTGMESDTESTENKENTKNAMVQISNPECQCTSKKKSSTCSLGKSPSRILMDQMCDILQQLPNQINELMVKMKQMKQADQQKQKKDMQQVAQNKKVEQKQMKQLDQIKKTFQGQNKNSDYCPKECSCTKAK
ncbi:Uncharacterized protein OBRU01_06869 [Operophtera brumata]|uniref:PHD-type domain-containing protein n=1 Tax=Operophtera brumata TaxID=104452 RepID=A0A0L7LJ65_OPEBR|nr:Uncharacterized protein OBRU01_06869 [Operophtera brumata]